MQKTDYDITSIRFVKENISHLVEVQKILKHKGKPSTIIGFKLSFAYAVLEFLKTGDNIVHKGRLRSFWFNKSPRSLSAYMLIEETANTDVHKFCNMLMSKVFTFTQMTHFKNNINRRYNKSSV